MMNLFQLQEQLKDFSKEQLVREMQSPSGNAPPFLVMTELQRRTRMENAAALDKGPPTSTVAQDAVNAAGVPQGGIADMARSLAPQTNMTQNTGALTPQAGAMPQGAAPVQAMQDGGLAGISRNVSDFRVENDPAVVAMARRLDMTPEEYLASLDPEVRATQEQRVSRNQMQSFDPLGDGMTFPSQEDLDLRAAEGPVTSEMLTERGIAQGGVNPSSRERDEIPLFYEEPMVNETMSRGVSGISTPGQSAPYRLADLPGTSEDYAESLSALAEGRAAVPSPRRRSAGDLSDLIDVSDTTFAAPSSAEAPFDRSYQPPTMGATELNTPAMLAALGGPEPTAPSAYRSMDEMVVPEDTRFSDALAGRPGVRNLGEMLMDDVRNTAALLSPFATSEERDAAAADMRAAEPQEDVSVPEAPVLMPEAPTGGSATSGATVGGMPVPPPQSAEDRMLQQDKWLALARFGAALASSQAPTFGQALGQAGQVGLDALSKARQDFLTRKEAADKMAMARATLAARTAGGGGTDDAPDIGLSTQEKNALGALNEEIARVEQALMNAEADAAAATGTLWGNPSAEQLATVANLRRGLGSLMSQRTNITQSGAGMPITGGVAPPATMDYDLRE